MKIRGLQQQLAANDDLLPSQRELLTRLLFQLAFNDFTRLAIVGGAGTGKSMLAVVLAELFSNCQEMTVNVALVRLPIADGSLLQALAQQWFATTALSVENLQQRISDVDGAEFVLILDNAEELDSADWNWLQTLNIRILSFRQQPDNLVQLNLTVPAVTLDDCHQLLRAEQLDALAVAQRFALAEGNLHHLLDAKFAKVTKTNTQMKTTSNTHTELKFPWPLAILTSLMSLLVIVLWLTPVTIEQPLQLTEDTLTTLTPSSVNTFAAESENNDESNPVEAENLIAPKILDNTESDSDAISEPDTQIEATATQLDESAPLLTLASEPIPDQAPTVPENLQLEPEVIDSTAVVDKHTQSTEVIHPILDWNASQRLVQLAVLSEQTAVKRFQADFPKVSYQVYQRRWQGKEQWVIIAGPFASNNQALQYIDVLPERLKRSGPFPKSVRAVQQEILAWQRTNSVTVKQEN